MKQSQFMKLSKKMLQEKQWLRGRNIYLFIQFMLIYLYISCAGSLLPHMGSSLTHTGLVLSRHVGSQFLDQSSNPHPLDWKVDSLPLEHQGNQGHSV